VAISSFLAADGDGFTVFNEGTDALGGAQDIDALVAAFAAAEPDGIAVHPSIGSWPCPDGLARRPDAGGRQAVGSV
jgi:hypothetical protein